MEANKSSKKELLISVFFAVLFVGLVAVLVIANFRINVKREEMVKRIDQLKTDIKQLEDKNKELNKNLNSASTNENLEKLAREQLGLKKPGEEVVIVRNQEEEEVESAAFDKSSASQAGGRRRNFWDPREWWNIISGR